MALDVSIIGGSGYAGGELVRLLLGHPEVNLKQVTSERQAGKFVRTTHPNLRKVTDFKFVKAEKLEPCDVIFLALPHGVSMQMLPKIRDLAPVVIDLSSDFRLNNPDDYPTWYSHEHNDLEALGRFVYGMPELHREEIRTADWIASPGCMSTTSILGLYPLFRAGVVDLDTPVIVEVKTGSSGSGGSPSVASHHAERSGAMRSFKPTGHRHTAEVVQELTVDGAAPKISFSATSIEAVRGILATSHVFINEDLQDKELRAIYRDAYKDEPFMRLVKENAGIYRYPEPKILSGSNWCDVGFERDPHTNRVVVMAATDNLMKGASGQAVQAFNIRMGFDETTAIDFPGLHPI
ncbi:MAG TPA: N-acetyl-gamma-glutamyl-phosphate reductase [Thermomicrobiales bacterium]|nr:N-acetyl-gamma-glutamyl-phosphate reductase [Thermomicrobiales bacterium]